MATTFDLFTISVMQRTEHIDGMSAAAAPPKPFRVLVSDVMGNKFGCDRIDEGNHANRDDNHHCLETDRSETLEIADAHGP